jgi:hypothetical protein
LLLVFFTAALVVVTYKLYGSGEDAVNVARQSANIASDALVTSNRAWVKIDVAIDGPLVKRESGAAIKLKYTLTNVGHSPATDVTVTANAQPLVPSALRYNTDFISRIQNLRANRPKPNPDVMLPQSGIVLFPDDPNFAQPGNLFINLSMFAAATVPLPINPIVVGGVYYHTGLDEKTHLTTFAFQIVRKDVPRSGEAAKLSPTDLFLVDLPNVPATDLDINNNIWGGYAD